MINSIKSGKQILDDFFKNIHLLDNVDSSIAEVLTKLYQQGKLTDINLKNELQTLRDKNARTKN
jgi:hypothetical protein